MDMDSPDKPEEGIKEENGSSPSENPSIDLFWNKDDRRDGIMHESEVPNNGMQVCLDQEYPVSSGLHVGVENQDLESLSMKSNSAGLPSPANNHEETLLPNESDLSHQKMEGKFYTEEQLLSIDDYQSNAKKERVEDADHLAHPGVFLDNSVNETCNNEFHTESSYSLAHNSLLTGDNNNCYHTMGEEASNHRVVEFPPLNEAENGDMEIASANFQSDMPEVHTEMDGGNLSDRTEAMEDDHSNAIASSENGGMVWENSSLHSPQRTKNASPSTERQFSISAERSSHLQPPLQNHPSSGQGKLSEANNDNKTTPSPSSSKRKCSPSPDKQNECRLRRPSSRDHSSSARQRSPSGRTTQRDSHNRDGSPRRHIAHSPRRQGSPRRSRSSCSPLKSRDSPGRRRDPHRRSRSRSPYARDHCRRSPRRRPSPRRRSPPTSYSRRRSPNMAWSPPANRKTGLGKPGKKLFIAGFSYATTERDLEKKFSRFGHVTDVHIVHDKRSVESRGFGFVSLERDEDADAAIRALDQTEWNGRHVLVEKSKSSTR